MRGSCLCGEVVFEIEGEVTPIGHCHCSKCRKVTGSGAGAVFWVLKDRGTLHLRAGRERVHTFRTRDGWSSVFCEQCGSALPHQSQDGSRWFVPAGAMDDDPEVKSAVHIYVGSKAPWEDIHGPLPQLREGIGSQRVD